MLSNSQVQFRFFKTMISIYGSRASSMYVLSAVAIFACFSIGVSRGETYDYVERYFPQKLDHFNFASYGNGTYQQRYLYNDTWRQDGDSPIFFYAGNEGDITGFWSNSGFVFKAAKQLGALVVFAEHRYYGKSLPFGNDSFTGINIGLLSIEQALADYAYFIKSFKTMFKAEKSPVIAFGGSYGGMLAAYMRFKYPNIIHGAIAASAPLYLVAGEMPGDVFFQAVTKDFSDISHQCEFIVRQAFLEMADLASQGPAGFDQISKTFHLCPAIKSTDDYEHLLMWIRNAFVMAAMMDYPYPASFMGNFPAFPVKVMCQRLAAAPTPTDGLFSAAALYYNASQTLKCFDTYAEYIYCADPTGCGLGFDSTAWDYQACTEINLEGSTTGEKDMFPVLIFDSKARDKYCYKKYKVLPRRNQMDVIFWGKDITSSSNIVFSNGNLDPWAVGGILKNLSDSLVSVLVDGGAHHLDLRGDDPNDPQSVKDARNFELRNIQKWLAEYYSKL